jgi:hypothetical protein
MRIVSSKHVALVCASLIAGSACAPGEPEASTERDTSEDASPASLPERDTSEAPSRASLPERWAVVEEQRIGSVADEEQILTRVSSIEVDANGRVYIAQPDDNTVKVFDREGWWVLTMGGSGQGPGEFRRLAGMGIIGDTLFASDILPRRVTMFSLAGEVIGTFTLAESDDADAMVRPGTAFVFFPDGTLGAGIAFVSGAPEDLLRRVPSVRVDRSGRVVDTLAFESYAGRNTLVETADPSRPVNVVQPFLDNDLTAVARDGTRVAQVARRSAQTPDVASFRVTVMASLRDTIYSRDYAYTPIPMMPVVVDSAVARSARGRVGYFASEAAAVEAIRAAVRVPEFFSPVSEVEFSPDRHIWIRREDLPDVDQSWMVLDEDGAVVAEFALPYRFDVRLITSDAVWGVQLGELDVPYVVKYRTDKGVP